MMEVVVGKVARAHGLHCEAGVEVRTDQPELRFADGATLRATGEWGERPLVVRSTRWHGNRLLVRFEDVTDRTAAERLRGAVLVADVPEDESPEDPDEFYDHQLIGLAVETVDGEALGEVHEVVHLPMQELLAVRAQDGGEVFVPFVKDIVPEVDLASRKVVVDPPPGLLTPGGPTSEAPGRSNRRR